MLILLYYFKSLALYKPSLNLREFYRKDLLNIGYIIAII